MIRREFVWAENERTGMGWRLKALPDFDPVYTFGLAHDTMEHFDLSGSIEDEGRAFGAMLWGRHFGGWWAQNSTSRAEFSSQLSDECAEFVAMAGHVRPLRAQPLDAECEEQIAELRRRALKVNVSDWTSAPRREFVANLDQFCNWIRVGYRATQRRWGKHMSPSQFCDLFSRIADNPLCSYKFEPDSELDRLVVSVSPTRRTVDVSLISYVDPYA